MSSDAVNAALIHYNDTVSILHTRYSLGDNKFGGIRNFSCKRFSYSGIGSCINGTCTVIKNYNLRFLKKSPCNTKSLFLSAGNIASALLNISIISIWKAVNKFVCTCKTACSLTFFFRGILVSPSEVIKNRSRKRTFFCNTTLTSLRSVSISYSLTSLPPTLTEPSVTS